MFEDGGSGMPRNIGKCLTDCRLSHPEEDNCRLSHPEEDNVLVIFNSIIISV